MICSLKKYLLVFPVMDCEVTPVEESSTSYTWRVEMNKKPLKVWIGKKRSNKKKQLLK